MSSPTWQSDDGSVNLYLGDCLEILPTLEKGSVEAVVTDPPYGIGWDSQAHKDSGRKPGVSAAAKRNYERVGWDDVPISQQHLDSIRAVSRWQIIFGGNYFALPPARCWLVWDKKTGTNEFADCELAWTNLDKPVRRIEWMWNGMIRKGREERNEHPTQKPCGVMEWCIGNLPNTAQTILDPFMGSGTTGVACVKLGRKFIGIEKEPEYFEKAKNRIQQAIADEKANLFRKQIDAERKAESQMEMFNDGL